MNDTNKRKRSRQLDGSLLAQALIAGIRHLFTRRDYINRINVFPVPDSDTGTNMAFTFKAILQVTERRREAPLSDLVGAVSEAALDGARGNSGAIMAQYFQGFQEACAGLATLNAAQFAAACSRGAEQAWGAMSEPVPGTLPTVMEDHARALQHAAERGVRDLRRLFVSGLDGARTSLVNTPNLLPALKQAGVVDAGGQGFVDLLEGIAAFLTTGRVDELDSDWVDASDDGEPLEDFDVGAHQFCTECVIEGAGLDREAVMQRLQTLDQSSLVVAGNTQRVRVHIHVNSPAEVFLACEEFGEITQQKADDMQWQHSLLNQPGQVAVVTDSAADLPAAEVDRLGMQVVPVRLSFGDRDYLDGVTLETADFPAMLAAAEVAPQTSQPPPKDFRRVFELLGSHGYEVLYVGLSSKLSGTFQAGESAAKRCPDMTIEAVDSMSASAGQGLLALMAAEMAVNDAPLAHIEQHLQALVPLTQIMAMPDELQSAVRGGRVPSAVGKLARWLRLMPVLTAKDGRLTVAGFHTGHRVNPDKLARRVLRAMDDQQSYRVLISHLANKEDAQRLRRLVLEGHPQIHSCHIADAGPALGVHLGLRGLAIGFLPDIQSSEQQHA